MQGNETTLGYEAGAKGLFLQRRLAVIGMGFAYFNQNISRRNPRYDDPIFDAGQTQPQLVASGEEYRLAAGDVVAFRGDQRHSYVNAGARPAIAYSVVVIARR